MRQSRDAGNGRPRHDLFCPGVLLFQQVRDIRGKELSGHEAQDDQQDNRHDEGYDNGEGGDPVITQESQIRHLSLYHARLLHGLRDKGRDSSYISAITLLWGKDPLKQNM
jgi:hypothetical protein